MRKLLIASQKGGVGKTTTTPSFTGGLTPRRSLSTSYDREPRVIRPSPNHSIQSTGLADVLERVLDKGLIIAGDIKIKLLDIELLTIQIRLMVASVDKAREMGMDWWSGNLEFSSRAHSSGQLEEVSVLRERVQ